MNNDMSRMEIDYQTVEPIIRHSKAKDPVKAHYFDWYYGIKPREVRLIVSEMRKEGQLVVGNSNGYYMAKDWDEYEQAVREHVNSSYTYLKQFNALKKKFTGSDEKQLALELNIYENKEKGDIVETREFTYQKESNGEIGKKRVFVLHEDDTRIEGIDLNLLNPDEQRELDEANATIIRLKAGKYKRYNKRSIIE
jgi:hypothetical protein